MDKKLKYFLRWHAEQIRLLVLDNSENVHARIGGIKAHIERVEELLKDKRKK